MVLLSKKIADYDTLDCPRCGSPRRPLRINKIGSARYRCECGDGSQHLWTINLSGELVNEVSYLSTSHSFRPRP